MLNCSSVGHQYVNQFKQPSQYHLLVEMEGTGAFQKLNGVNFMIYPLRSLDCSMLDLRVYHDVIFFVKRLVVLARNPKLIWDRLHATDGSSIECTTRLL